MTERPLLQVNDLRVEFPTPSGSVHAVRGISFEIDAGERVAVVGESGSGKSVTALSLIGLTPPPGQLTGSVKFKHKELVGLSERELTRVRGCEVGLILQDATAAVDPLKTVGAHIEESLRMHTDISASDARERTLELVRQVRISDPELRVRQFSHELSGGMAQRAVTASVIGLRPDLLIADEPTSALDATTADGVLDLLRELGRDTGMAVLLITHDLGIVARFAERVIVMYAGRIVEQGMVGDIFAHPRHPYTKGLLASMPGIRGRRSVQAIPAGSPEDIAPTGCAFRGRCAHSDGRDECLDQRPELRHRAGPDSQLSACHFADELAVLEPPSQEFDVSPTIEDVEILRVDDVRKDFFVKSNLLGHGGAVTAVAGASFRIRRGEVLGLVGESGSGKSTTGKLILGLESPTAGQLHFDGIDICKRVERRDKDLQRRMQVVFQNPNSSLDPRMRVGEIISEPLDVHRIGSHAERKERVAELLGQVGLEPEHADRYPFEFSGGQRQRIAIARALAPRPEFIVCDEPLTALDVSVQAQILNLLQDIQIKDRLSYLFIAHDLAVVRQIADRVAVMYLGNIVETGSAEEFFESPHHPYSMALLSAMSSTDPVVEQTRERIILRGPVPSPLNPPSGCAFHTRCWKVQDVCRRVGPPVLAISEDRTVACHFPEHVESGVPVHLAEKG